MFQIFDEGITQCDGINRREWLRIGTASTAGMASFFGRPATAAPTTEHDPLRAFGKAKRAILFWLNGGPPQQETWDVKTQAPIEVRGPFQPIASRIPGMDVCELMPKTALLTDKIAVLRAVVTKDNAHSSSGYQMLTGTPHVPLNQESVTAKAPNLWPCVDSILRHLKQDAGGVPTSVAVPEHVWNDGNFPWPGQDGGFLGRRFDPWLIHCDPSQETFKIPDLALQEGVSPLRFDSRQSLLQQINSHLDRVDRTAAVKQYDFETQQAVSLLSAGKTRAAFDLSLESNEMRDRYGRSRYAQSVLLSRRLVEAGVSLVRINWTRVANKENQGGWDTHAKNADSLKSHLMPVMDQAYSALLEDLSERGMLDDTLVVWIGEFGRTPRHNGNAGRDHWGHCFSMAFAGGGIRGGQVYGASDRDAAYPTEGAVSAADVTATIFHCLGYHADTEVHDNVGRPFPISRGQVISQVF